MSTSSNTELTADGVVAVAALDVQFSVQVGVGVGTAPGKGTSPAFTFVDTAIASRAIAISRLMG